MPHCKRSERKSHMYSKFIAWYQHLTGCIWLLSEPFAPETLFKRKNQHILAMPLFMSSSLRMKTAVENMVGLSLLTTSELVWWIVCLASDPVKFFRKPPVLEPGQSSINYLAPVSNNNELYYVAFHLKKKQKQLQEQKRKNTQFDRH